MRCRLFISLLALTFYSAFSQKTDIQFEHLSMKDGLSMNPVMAIAQDKKGFLWFGTQDGLNRYDGYSFKVFKTKDGDSSSISDNFITALAADSTGNVWAGTLSGGLNCYNTKKGDFTRYGAESPLVGSNRIWSLFLDGEHQLWIGTENGLRVIDPVTRKAIAVPGAELQKDLPVLAVFRESSGDVWLGTTNGALRYRMAEKTLDHFTASGKGQAYLSHNIVLSFHEDSKGNIWIGTLDGLNRFDRGTATITHVYFKERTIKPEDKDSKESTMRNIYSIVNNYGGNTIRTILEDDKGIFWIGTDMELIIYDPATQKFINYKKDLVNPTAINDHFIRSMFIDRSGNLWIGTLSNGLNKTSLHPKKFRHYQKKANDSSGLSENYVRAICEDDSGNIWVGTLVGGLNRFDPETEVFLHYPPCVIPKGKCPNDNNVWSLCFDKKGLLWIGTNNGLNQYDPVSETYTYYVHDARNPASLSENTVRSIFCDSKGNLWAGTEGGLNRFNYSTGTFTVYSRSDHPDSLSDNTVWKIIEDGSGRLWLATNNGLNCFDPASGKFSRYLKVPGKTNSISHNGIRTLHIDAKGRLWVGTHNGLNRFDPASGTFIRYDETSGLPNAFIYAILEDEQGCLWLSTNKGLCCFNPADGSVKSFDVYDGLQDYEFNTNASCRTRSGEMYFAGPAGMNRFSPSKLGINQFNPTIEITGMSIKGKPYESDVDITEVQEIVLNYDENVLLFEFSSFDYTRPERNRYRFMMEGFDSDWVDAKNARFTTYTNLDPGEYVFRVQGTNVDGVWSPYSDSIRIVILPPFWKTAWFYALCLIFIVTSVYAFYRIRVAGLRREKLLLAQKVKERTLELEEINRELEKLSLVASKTDNAVLIADPEGIIEWTNEGLKRMHSKKITSPANIYGKSLLELSSNPEIAKVLEKSKKQKISVSYEAESTNSEGRNFWVQSTLTPILDEKGDVSKIVIIDSDITARKEAEEIIREKNKDITDSINYALRIQQALLPDEAKINTFLEDSFILFRPRDIVSGDFYFVEGIQSNEDVSLTGFAVGDCTGHGVPGAFMSMIGTSFLKQSLSEHSVNSPAEALDFVSRKINELLRHNDEKGAIRDGMDISFCVLDPRSNTFHFAGANRSVVIVDRKGLREIKGDSRTVGYSEEMKPFANHAMQLQKGDCVYLFTDGYADQFGGPKGKKFKHRKLLEKIASVAHLPMPEQKRALEQTFDDWKGNLAQVDDVCLMGVRV
ncbi:MAG: two-component regulator propeller domain-containing protein [Bacteroidota bacterium]